MYLFLNALTFAPKEGFYFHYICIVLCYNTMHSITENCFLKNAVNDFAVGENVNNIWCQIIFLIVFNCHSR